MRDRWIRLAVLMAAVSLVGGCQSCGLDFDVADLNPFGDCTTCETPVAQAPCDPPPQDPCAPTPVAQPVAVQQPVGNRPPDARAGEVWCYVRIPAVTETVSEQVCVQPESSRQVWVEPVNQQVTERVCVQPESSRVIEIPAQFQDVAEQVCTAPGKTEWRRVDCEAQSSLKPQEQIGECWTLVDVPPTYVTQTKRVCTQPASSRTELIPAVFENQTKTVCVKPGFYKTVSVPPVFETQTRTVTVCGPRWEWRRTTECEVPAEAGMAPIVNQPAPVNPNPAPVMDPAGGNQLPPVDGFGDAPPAGQLPPLDPMAPIK